jgi:hypothetical protein
MAKEQEKNVNCTEEEYLLFIACIKSVSKEYFKLKIYITPIIVLHNFNFNYSSIKHRFNILFELLSFL